MNYSSQAVISAVKSADVAILCVGIDTSYESEGLDRTTLDLPGYQMQLIQDAHSVGMKNEFYELLRNWYF